MSKLKIVFLSTLGLIDVVLIMISIGYLIMGIKSPNSLGGRELSFTGNYMLFAFSCQDPKINLDIENMNVWV